MKVVIIVQARMTSTRLPGKVLKTVLGKPLLEYQIERLRRVKLADKIVIATTINETDLPIIDLCQCLSIAYFRGSEEDVLARYYDAAKSNEAEVVVRVTSDCPLIDPDVIDRVIQCYLEHYPKYDYVSNCLERTYPRGMDTEVFSYSALERAFQEAAKCSEREHVTPFIYNKINGFCLKNIACELNLNHYRWTVDTSEDFQLIKQMIEVIYPINKYFSLSDCLSVCKKHSDWIDINKNIEQKTN
jgi:spore coat polysaccharide biosynthesis protein SpsF